MKTKCDQAGAVDDGDVDLAGEDIDGLEGGPTTFKVLYLLIFCWNCIWLLAYSAFAS